MVGSRRLIVFVAIVLVVLSLAAVWSRKNNCDEWLERVTETLGSATEGLTLIGPKTFEILEPARYGCGGESDLYIAP